MHWWDKLRYNTKKRQNWARNSQNHFWSGVSVLIFKSGTADDPIRLRLNIITISFTFLILVSLPTISLINLISENWQAGDEVKNIQSRMLKTIHIRSNLEDKNILMEKIDTHLNKFHAFTLRNHDSVFSNLFTNQMELLRDTDADINTGQKHYNLELLIQLHKEARFLFSSKSYHAMHPLWHRLTLYHSMPRGRPLPAGAGMITSGFGRRDNPTENDGQEFHTGIDFGDAPGTPIIATASGIVFKAMEDPSQGYGNHVRIHHGFGITTLYAHCQSLAVKEGDFIHKGQVIAFLGKTGRATGNHIHYEVAYGNEPSSDPVEYIQMK